MLLDCGGVAPDDSVTSVRISAIAFSAMIRMGYNAINIGPNEAFFVEKTNYPGFVSANMMDLYTSKPITAPYKLFKVSGLTIAVMGITPDPTHGNSTSLKILQADKALRSILQEVNKVADMTILLSQFSARETELILNATGKIDLAISSPGGIHEKVKKLENGSRIVSTGNGCSKLQSLDVLLENNELVDVTKETITLGQKILMDPDIIAITGFDKNETIAEMKEKELERMKQKAMDLSKTDPMEYIKKMSEIEPDEESKARLQKQLQIGKEDE